MFARNMCRFVKLHAAPMPFHHMLLRSAAAGRKYLLSGPPFGRIRPCFGRMDGRMLRRPIQHQKPPPPTTHPAATLHALRMLWDKLFSPKYLLATNVISSGVLMVIGDLLAQEIEYRRNGGRSDEARTYDLQRLGRMFVVGALQGPLHHYIYRWMDRIMPVANFRNAVWKILIDQIVMSPVCILMFFYSACALERKSLQETNQEVIDKFPYIYLFDWMVWPGVQYVNFRYLDTKYRVMFVNVATALYNIFMSYMKHDFEVGKLF